MKLLEWGLLNNITSISSLLYYDLQCMLLAIDIFNDIFVEITLHKVDNLEADIEQI